MNFQSRLERLKEALKGPLLVLSPGNVFYLSGFRGSLGFLLVFPGGKTFFFCDGRYATQSREELAVEAEIVEFEQDAVASICDVFFSSRENLLFVEDVASVGFIRRFEEKKCPVIPCPSPVNALRAVKDEAEIRAIRRAVTVAEEAFRDVLPLIQEGISEHEIAVELEYRMRRRGGEAIAFPTIVASGKRAALPHARPTSARVKKGEWVLVDWGVRVDGYCADLTRVVPVGEVQETPFRKAFAALLEAQAIALELIREGVEAKTVDQKVREVLRKSGFERYFIHSLGHGVGIDVHEEPKLSTQSTAMLHRGMVVTVEPGIYSPEWGGVRLEHMVLVEERSCKVLDTLPETFDEKGGENRA